MHAVSTMVTETNSQQPRTLVVGLGKTGLSCARFLARKGVEVAVTDSREQPPCGEQLLQEAPDVPVFFGGFDAAVFNRAERIVVSPGVSVQIPLLVEARQRGIEIIGDIELFARTVQAPVIAITGSNGKSTVTTLVAAMARRAGFEVRAGGNLGTPALELIEENEPDLYVLELSSFQLETVYSLQPKAAVVLNVSPDHMDRYATLGLYAQAKQSIYKRAQHRIINRDDPLAAALAEQLSVHDVFGIDVPSAEGFALKDVKGVAWLTQDGDCLLPADQVRIPGRHNLSNALAALALGSAAAIPMPAMLQTLKEFKGLPHRTQWVAEANGLRWYNDSKATNIGAALAAIRGIPGPIVLIAGGQGKGADFSELTAGVRDELRAAVLIGEDAALLASALEQKTPCHLATDLDEAVVQAQALAQPGDAVLLAPACASFDMFRDYAERGDVFMAAVQRQISR
jgi:UDP-N-acetylmuramoylalanine--D-glutamate ligase